MKNLMKKMEGAMLPLQTIILFLLKTGVRHFDIIQYGWRSVKSELRRYEQAEGMDEEEMILAVQDVMARIAKDTFGLNAQNFSLEDLSGKLVKQGKEFYRFECDRSYGVSLRGNFLGGGLSAYLPPIQLFRKKLREFEGFLSITVDELHLTMVVESNGKKFQTYMKDGRLCMREDWKDVEVKGEHLEILEKYLFPTLGISNVEELEQLLDQHYSTLEEFKKELVDVKPFMQFPNLLNHFGREIPSFPTK